MKKSVVRILILVLAAVLSLGLSACAAKPAASTTFKVGLECAYAPFNWTQTDAANGAVKISGTNEYAGGYDVEIAKLIAKGLGRELVIVKTAWDGLPPAVVSGTIDAIIAGMSPTADRKQTIDFSDSYYRSELVMVVRKGGAYEKAASIADFAGAKVTAQLNTFHYKVIEQIKGVNQQTAMDDFSAMRVALDAGMIDAYVSEKPEAVSACAVNSKFAYVEFAAGKGFTASDEDVTIAVGLKKGQPELTKQINTILAGISEDQRKQLMDTALRNQPASN